MLIILSAHSVGGYEHTFVDEIAAKYHCNICSKVLRDARLTVCCGQHYCDSCLEQWSASKMQDKETCPYCREEGFEHVLDKSVIREINEFRVKCTNHEEGCGWVGELGDLEKHIESENGCGYAMVKCNNSGHLFHHVLFEAGCPATCDHRCQRQSLAEHQKICKYRHYKCEYCGLVDTYDAIAGDGLRFLHSHVPNDRIGSNHYTTCEQYPVECLNKCGQKTIKRCDIPSHRDQCPLEPLPCPFKNVGCSSMIPRCDMDSHCQTNMQTHLLMMAKSHDKLLRKNNELLQKNEEFVCKNQELAQKVGELAHKNEELNHQCEQVMRRLDALEARPKPLLPF